MDLVRLGLLVGAPYQTRYPAHENTPVAEARKECGLDAGLYVHEFIHESIANELVSVSKPASRVLA